MNTLIKFLILFTLLGCEPAQEFTGYEEDMAQRTQYSRTGTIRVGSRSAQGLSLQAELKDMSVHTIQFNLSPPRFRSGVPTNARPICKAIIDWVVSGNSVRRQIHVMDGMSISGTGEFVNISIVDESTGTLVNPNPYQYDVSVQISKGARGNQPNPPFLQDLSSPVGHIVTPGSATPLTVPQDIGVSSVYVSVSTTNVTIPPGVLAVQQFALATIVMGYDPRDFQWVLIAPGVDSISLIQGATGPGPARMTVFWGIDG